MGGTTKEKIKEKIEKFRDHQQINLIVTSFLIFASIYLALVTCLGEKVLDPFGDLSSQDDENRTESLSRVKSKDGSAEEIVNSSISLFFIITIGLIVGRGFFYLHLPPLLGSLLVGIGIRNIPLVNEWLSIQPEWDTVLRKLAFALIMIRCSIGINLQVVRSAPRLLISLGVLGPLIEASAVFLAAHFLFDFPLGISVIFGFLLAATSPAVTVPSMLHLQNMNYGTEKGIPSLVLACASADNVLLIVTYTVSMGLVFASDSMVKVMAITIGEIVASGIIGISSGWLLWWFPQPNASFTHLCRGILLLFISCAQLFIAIRLNIEFAGSIALVLTCLTAAFQWKRDNQKQTSIEQRSFATLWNLIFQPVLFVLIGMKFEIFKLSLNGVLIGVACLCIGCLARALAILLFTVQSGLRFTEQLIFVFSFLPKATVQAALAPSIVVTTSAIMPDLLPFAEIVLSASVVAILITAPLGQLALDLFGPKLLHQDHQKKLLTSGCQEKSLEENSSNQPVDQQAHQVTQKRLSIYSVDNSFHHPSEQIQQIRHPSSEPTDQEEISTERH